MGLIAPLEILVVADGDDENRSAIECALRSTGVAVRIERAATADAPDVVEREAWDLVVSEESLGTVFKAGELPLRDWPAPALVTVPQRIESDDEARIRLAVHRANERKQTIEQLATLARHTSAAYLPTRVVLLEHLALALSLARRSGSHLAVLFVDLDDFASVIDALGSVAADRLVDEIGVRLADCIRVRDTIGRVGSDQFVLLCATTSGSDDAAQIAARVLASIRQPLDLEGAAWHVRATVGISFYPDNALKPDELIAKAAAAMYLAKQNGRDAFLVYTDETEAGIQRTLELESDLRKAIAGEQFVIHYQPIVDAASWQIVGAEALIRWLHPVHGLIQPDEFVPFAEEHGLIAQIGAIALRSACAQLRRFALDDDDRFSIAVNVSARQLRQPRFAETVAAAVELAGVDPKRLEIEISEAVVTEDDQSIVATLVALKALGVTLSIEDFGTGHSSLTHIQIPAGSVKVDRSFVAGIAKNTTDQAITRTIVNLAHGLGLRVTAEGVESSEQVASLAALGCDNLQGYLIGRPLAAEEFERLVEAGGTIPRPWSR
ncbi:MAG TPA: bifunctional diguanylate cyclase/phosphodiesterase [Candidatus Acidoferrum sp.]|nr:bifunctional diguanylate cyclase/phosphodiesterase [Candidatus Acidoferrum sp.]